MTSGITVVSYPSGFIKLTMFLEPSAEGSLRLPNVGVVGVVVTRDVVDGAAQVLLGGFVLGCTSIEQTVLLGLWNSCIP